MGLGVAVSWLLRSLMAVVLLAAGLAWGDQALFESDELLEIRLVGPWKEINRERVKGKQYAGRLAYVVGAEEDEEDEQLGSGELTVGIEARGNKRLSEETCAFPPLRLVVKDGEGTVFAGQQKLKLVTQCRPKGKLYERYLITEYLAYRLLNALTPHSYRVRLARIEYVNEGGKSQFENYGFFIEASKKVAKRIGHKRWNAEKVKVKQLDGKHLNLVSLFQLMLGNADWSAVQSNEGECCHNGKLYGHGREAGGLFIPYDFDTTGLVNPEYGVPPAKLKLSSLKKRRYRGHCRNRVHLDGNIAFFNHKRDAITAVFADSPYLSKKIKKWKLAYIDKFYDIVNEPKKVQKYLHRWCLGAEN